MKIWIVVVLVAVSLGVNGWGQSSRPQTAAELGKYLGGDRGRVL